MALIALALTFIGVKLLPFCKGREACWIFVFTFPLLLGVNLKVGIKVFTLADHILPVEVAWRFFFVLALTAIGEIVMLLIARMVWKRQIGEDGYK